MHKIFETLLKRAVGDVDLKPTLIILQMPESDIYNMDRSGHICSTSVKLHLTQCHITG